MQVCASSMCSGEGKPLLSEYDPVAAVGPLHADKRTLLVPVTDGS